MQDLHYIKVKKVDTKNKDNLVDLYELLEKSGRLEIFMYDDSSMRTFIDKFHKQWLYLCLLDDEVVGFGGFDAFQYRSAFYHFCMFPKGDKYISDYARIIFDTVFRNDDLLTIFGLTPSMYRHMMPVIEKVGGHKLMKVKEACMVKGKLRDGNLVALTKEGFYNTNKELFL